MSDDGAADATTDHRLVAKVRRGDERAFELLYHRYQRRIHAYILGMVKDHGRAEDVTQEVFVSALRRMRATERPIAFKPWIYEIAKNACIDVFRRSKRAEEVSWDSEEGLAPADHSRLAWFGPTPDAAVAAKHDLESLCGAFGGLSETHHEILVLRELEGLSYSEIGRRMGMSRPAVESTLFRARRRLTEEYDDIVSGARCLRIQSIIQIAAQSRLGTRDTRRLARHLAHCQPCRREALEAGLDRSLIARPTVRERVSTRVAGLLPFPAFLRLRRGAEGAPPSGRGTGLTPHLPMISDQLSGGWGKLAAGGALLVAGVGAGVGAHRVATAPDRPAASSHPAAQTAPPAQRTAAASGADHTATVTLPASARTTITRAKPAATHRTSSTAKQPTRRAGSGSGGSTRPAAPAAPAAGSGGDGASQTRNSAGGNAVDRTKSAVQQTAGTVGGAVKQAAGAVNGAVQQTAGAVNGAVGQATGTVDGAVNQAAGAVNGAVGQATGGGTVAGAVHQATDAVGQTTGAATGALNQTTQSATGALQQTAGGLLGG